jgi:hypothetical protein
MSRRKKTITTCEGENMHTNKSHSPKLSFGKLTKSFLFEAPAGCYLVSNTGWPAVYEGYVEDSLAGRLAQWHRIVDVRANGRHCHLYDSKDDADLERAWIPIAIKTRSQGFKVSAETIKKGGFIYT